MSAIEKLSTVIHETLAKKNLSESRVAATRAAAGRCFDRPQLARAELLRLHLQAPNAAKVNSLYLFEIIVRYANDIIRKDGSGCEPANVLPSTAKAANPRTALVNAAKDFLKELATIVEEIAVNTASTVDASLREKVPKVIKIWRKTGAFDTQLLDKITAKVNAVAGPSQTKPASSAASPYGTHAIHKAGQSVKSTTPPGSPPLDVKGKFRAPSSGSGTQPGAPPLGLPSSLAALLGAQGPSADQAQGQEQHTSSGASTAEFMHSLNSLVGRVPSIGQNLGQPPASSSAGSLLSSMAGSMPGTGMPSFDMTQLSALQNLAQTYRNAERPGQTGSRSPPAGSGVASGSKPPSNSFPKVAGLPPKPGLPGPPPGPPPVGPEQAQSNGDQGGDGGIKPTIPYPPRPDPYAGDLSTFPLMQIQAGSGGDGNNGDGEKGSDAQATVVTFNPTIAWHWSELAKRWANSYGYMPGLVELAFNYLMTYQRSLMGAGFQGGMPSGTGYPGGFQGGMMPINQAGGDMSTAPDLPQPYPGQDQAQMQLQGGGMFGSDPMQAKGHAISGGDAGALGTTGSQPHQQGGGVHGLPPRPSFSSHSDGSGDGTGKGTEGVQRQTNGTNFA